MQRQLTKQPQAQIEQPIAEVDYSTSGPATDFGLNLPASNGLRNQSLRE